MQDTDCLERLLQASVRFLELEGVPRLGGRIFGVLLLSDRALTLDELTERAGLSKASASSNARLLLRLGLIESATPPGDRRDHYRLTSSGVRAPMELLLERLRALRDLYGLAASTDSGAPPEVRNRLRLDMSFIDHVSVTCEELMSQWEERTRGFSA